MQLLFLKFKVVSDLLRNKYWLEMISLQVGYCKIKEVCLTIQEFYVELIQLYKFFKKTEIGILANSRFLYIFLTFFNIQGSILAFQALAIEEFKELTVHDSLKNYDFKTIQKRILLNYDEFEIAKLYAETYIVKSIEICNNFYLAQGLLYYSRFSNDSSKVKYLRKAIEITETNANKHYPATAFLELGNFYFEKARYKKALDLFIDARKWAFNKSNERLLNIIKFNIGLLKSRIGNYQEASVIFEELWNIQQQKNISDEYLWTLFAVSDSEMRLGNYNKASEFNKKGITISKEQQNNIMYYYFVMNEGVNLNLTGNYEKSLDSLNKVSQFIIEERDISNIMFTQYYIGKAKKELGLVDESIKHFRSVDSVFMKTQDFAPELRDSYKILIDHYKQSNDLNKQLLYLSNLIKVDSVLTENYKYINSEIIENFDTPNLIEEKEFLINNLNSESALQKKWLIVLIITATLLLFILFLNYKRKLQYRKKFNELISKNSFKQEELISSQKKSNNSTLSKLSPEVVEKIRSGIEKFILNKEFLKKDISVNSLANNLKTNSKYLSIYVNHEQGNKFSDFINELRISYVIEKLKNDKVYRSYKITYLANEAGFSNTVTFNQAFYKKTKLKPSYFIKKLNQL